MSERLPTPGRVVLYRTDGRNGLAYDLPALVVVTHGSHPGYYPDGRANPLPRPADGSVHLTVASPGGFGTTVDDLPDTADEDFPGALVLTPGSGTYVEWDVPHAGVEHDGASADVDDPAHAAVPPRSWRWPVTR